MAAYFASVDPRSVGRWQQKLLLGISAETQKRFDQRWADLRPFAAAGWFVYVPLSPLLERIALPDDFLALGQRTWVVVYGECNRWEHARCRPMEANWARAIRDQCRAAGIPFFLRGMPTGEFIPPDLLIRQFPSPASLQQPLRAAS
jgi:protein gp37